jgi:hypothetical protein
MDATTKVKLSDRIRAGCEAAPWVVDEVKKLEAELDVAEAFHRVAVSQRNQAYDELRKHSGTIGAVFDRDVWDRAKSSLPNDQGLRPLEEKL